MKKKDTTNAYVYYPCAVTAPFTRRLMAADAIFDEVCDERGGTLYYLCDPQKYEAVKEAMLKEVREA